MHNLFVLQEFKASFHRGVGFVANCVLLMVVVVGNSMRHHEISEYHQSTSKACIEALQILTVGALCMAGIMLEALFQFHVEFCKQQTGLLVGLYGRYIPLELQ